MRSGELLLLLMSGNVLPVTECIHLMPQFKVIIGRKWEEAIEAIIAQQDRTEDENWTLRRNLFLSFFLFIYVYKAAS